MYSIAVYDWSQLTTPPELSAANLAFDGGANDPAQSNYNPALPSWTDKTYTYLGGTPTKIKVNDDDALFEDGYVETGIPATLAEDVTINGTTYLAGSVVENEFSLLDSGGNEVWVLRINGENIGFVPQVPYYTVPAGVSFFPTEGRGGLAAESTDGISSTEPYAGVICFAPQTRIATPGGTRPVGRLRAGDRVLTTDHGACALVWTARTEVVFDGPDDPARPIRIARNTFGPGLPARALIVSPQHRLLVTGPGLPKGGVLAPARGLLHLPGVRVMRGLSRIAYVHVMLARHEILTAEGVASESFYPGPMAMRALSDASRASLTEVLGRQDLFPPARPLITRRQAQRMGTSVRVVAGQGSEALPRTAPARRHSPAPIRRGTRPSADHPRRRSSPIAATPAASSGNPAGSGTAGVTPVTVTSA